MRALTLGANSVLNICNIILFICQQRIYNHRSYEKWISESLSKLPKTILLIEAKQGFEPDLLAPNPVLLTNTQDSLHLSCEGHCPIKLPKSK